MTYREFKELVVVNGWTVADLRCNTPPSPELLEVIDGLGLVQYEQFVARYENEVPA